jgi:hypothetical protein
VARTRAPDRGAPGAAYSRCDLAADHLRDLHKRVVDYDGEVMPAGHSIEPARSPR